MPIIIAAATALVLVVYGGALRAAIEAGWYWILPLCLLGTLGLGYLVSNDADREEMDEWVRWLLDG